MDWTPIIVNLAGLIAACGGFSGIVTLKENRRAKKLENDKSAASEWKELYTETKEEVKELNKKIDELYGVLKDQRETIDALNTQVAVSRLCECKKISCPERDPPFGTNSQKTIEKTPKRQINT